jgi:hypothetical protein
MIKLDVAAFQRYIDGSRRNWAENKLDHMSDEDVDSLIEEYIDRSAAYIDDFDLAFPFVVTTVILMEYRLNRIGNEVPQ